MNPRNLKEIADYFIILSNATQNSITNMKLQKLLYYAQAWHLALFSSPLFEEDFEAWVHGPVIPELYHLYKHFTWHPIQRDDLVPEQLEEFEKNFGSDLNNLMQDIVNVYFGLTAYELESLTHQEDPWKLARQGIESDTPSSNIITKESMKVFYKNELIKAS